MNGESLDYSQRLVGLRLRFGKQFLIWWLVYANCLFLFMFCLMLFCISRHVRQYSRSLTICCLSLPREQRYVVVYNHVYFLSDWMVAISNILITNYFDTKKKCFCTCIRGKSKSNHSHLQANPRSLTFTKHFG